MRLEKASKKAMSYACHHFHYSKRVPAVSFGYSVFNDLDQWCGIISFTNGVSKTSHKAQLTPLGLSYGEVIELGRVALNGLQGPTSRAVSLALKLIKKHKKLVKVVVSFADIDADHIGTIYQAMNWIYLGQTGHKEKLYIINGEYLHRRTVQTVFTNEQMFKDHYRERAIVRYSKGKHKYVYPLDRSLRKELEKLGKPYPKKEISASEALK